MSKVLIASDPEIFVSRDGVVVPAFQFLGKQAQCRNIYDPAYRTPYWDGFQAEFRTFPKSCIDELTGNISSSLWRIKELAPPNSNLDVRSVIEIPKEMLRSCSEEHVELGCDPSFNVYGIEPVNIMDARRLKYRFAGYHFHFGIPDVASFHNDTDLIAKTVKHLDATIGLIGVSMFEHLDNPIRRRYYGRAGEFRLPAHGLEYRTLSSSVLVHPAVNHLLWDVARRVVHYSLYGATYDEDLVRWELNFDPKQVQRIINQYDAAAARDVIASNEDFFKEILIMAYGYNPKLVDFAWQTILRPIDQTVKIDIEGNWPKDTQYYTNWRLGSLINMQRTDWPDLKVPFVRPIHSDRWVTRSSMLVSV